MAKDLNNILLSTIEENKIKEKTPDKLPLNPTAEGWSGHEVRRFLAKSLTDNEGSFLSEFKKKMVEIKTHFEDVFGEGDGKIQDQIDNMILENANIFKDVNYNNINGVLTFTKYDDTTKEIDLRQSIKEGIVHHGESEPELKKGVWLDENVEGVGVDDVIVIKGTDLQVVGNVSGQIPVLQDLIVKGAEINLIEGSSGQIQISGGEITIVNAEGVEEILIDETLTVSSVDMVSGTKYITIKNVIPII